MITVALPIWNNKDILWLPLEGLSRQAPCEFWELIVSECPGDNKGLEILTSYKQRLKDAGCTKISYILNAERLPLGMKWRQMAKRAIGDIFLLQASDEYPHPRRLAVSRAKIGDATWYDCRFSYTYSLNTRTLIFFDKNTHDKWHTGYDMAIRTEKVWNLPPNTQRRGVDFWLFERCGQSVVRDQGIYAGVATNGANSISMSRERHFSKPYAPFQSTTKTIDDLGLPAEIVARLKETTHTPSMEKFKEKYVKIRFLSNGKEGRVQPEYLDVLEKKNLVEQIDKPIVEPIDIIL